MNAKRLLFTFAALLLLILAATPDVALASTGGGGSMPWDAPLQKLLDSLTGSTGRILAGLMLAIGGIVWGFTRHERGAKRLGQGIVGIAIVLGAVQLTTALGFSGAVM